MCVAASGIGTAPTTRTCTRRSAPFRTEARPAVEREATAARIGLIGGLGLRAGVHYYEALAQRSLACGEPLDLLLAHADLARVLRCIAADDRASLGAYLGGIANVLFAAGARVVAIAAVAPHLAIDEICRVAQGPIVSVLDTVATELKTAALGRVAIIGNRVVIESNLFGTLPERAVVPIEPALVDEIHALYTEIAVVGKRQTAPEIEQLERIADELNRRGAHTIILAGTDLSSFYGDQPPRYPSFDLAGTHIDAIFHRRRG